MHIGIVVPETWNDNIGWDTVLDLALPSGSGSFEQRYPHNVRASNMRHMPPNPEGVAPSTQITFHTGTQLPDGRHSLLIDPGSKGNLTGQKTVFSSSQKPPYMCSNRACPTASEFTGVTRTSTTQ